ncbi:MAG: YigZ family protein [Gammaproteobacteria bacterium]|nr:MAG: YigZ family protein [Gammaproteobacteria bacterium]
MTGDNHYLVPARPARAELEVKRSRFIADIARASTAEEARAFVERIRAEFPDATHHCWAFQAGPPGDTRAIGCSDDGEPHGTAGRPMLNVLLHAPVGEVVAVVTRYFGGTKLGTGGLARAYADAVTLALAQLETERVQQLQKRTIVADYRQWSSLEHWLKQWHAEILEITYDSQVRAVIAIAEQYLPALQTHCAQSKITLLS